MGVFGNCLTIGQLTEFEFQVSWEASTYFMAKSKIRLSENICEIPNDYRSGI